MICLYVISLKTLKELQCLRMSQYNILQALKNIFVICRYFNFTFFLLMQGL